MMSNNNKLHYECRLCYVLCYSLKTVEYYKWLLDSFVLDYFVDDHWAKLPSTWRETLNNVEPHELCGLLGSEPAQCHGVVWPLSLLAFRAAGRTLVLPRERTGAWLQWLRCDCASCQACSELTKRLCRRGVVDTTGLGRCETSPRLVQDDGLNLSNDVNNLGDDVEARCIVHSDEDDLASKESGLMSSSTSSSKIMRVFEKHVKPKKRHEIFKMAQVAARTAELQGCHYVIDVGAGVGHLARMLAYRFGLRVCCLEAQKSLSAQARKLDKELELTLSKYLSAEDLSRLSRPVHLNTTLHSGIDPLQFVSTLSKAFGNVSPSELRFGIVGLHPCGDLGPMLLRLFQSCVGASFINIVGCCYMKLSQGPQATFQGYPLSDFVSREHHDLSYEACELSCHAVEAYSERLASGKYSDLMVHCFRAALERIIVKHWPHLRHSGIRSIKHNNQMTFAQYCIAATERLNINIPVEDFSSEETLENLNQWKKVVTFYSLRLLLAPLVESIILLDRVQCLRESGISCNLVPVFDPRLSPRNHVLIATKDLYSL
ncbi:methyltransferase-like protein 25B [Bacillus rossius redtenbacheri]|uniref:methyltransferase-like protein 25B n=1 Tax=Bacillus rossius redtenbacheri TaxID=93214 RepID=UPI002FDD68EE